MPIEDVNQPVAKREGQTVRKALGDNVARIRRLRQMTVRDLSAELKKLGLSLSPSGVSEIENAGRKVAVDELLVIAIALNTSPVDLLMPSDREQLRVAEKVDPAHGGGNLGDYPLLWWLQGVRPWSQFVSTEEFVDAARDPHRSILRSREMPVFKAIDALESPIKLALTGWPVNEPLAPILQHALDRLTKEVHNIIGSVDDAR